MARFFKKRDVTRGFAPGSLIFVGEQRTDDVQIRLIEYDESGLGDEPLKRIAEAQQALSPETVTWININGLHDIENMKEIGELFGLHSLLLEDILNTGQRPKFDESGDVIFVVLKMLRLEDEVVIAEQLSVVLGPTFLLTFQERPGDVFEPVRNRIRNSQGRVRASGPDYLAYALLDSVVDNYIEIIENLGGQVEDLELEVLTDATPSVLTKINNLRRELSFLRKSIRPAREAILRFSKVDSDLVQSETYPFLRDLNDISVQATESIETYRDMLSDELDIYNSTISNKMNDIMKVLTIFAAIFIPLTFIAGVYGTNFEYLPELHYKYSYFIFLGILIAVGAGMLVYFKKKKWI